MSSSAVYKITDTNVPPSVPEKTALETARRRTVFVLLDSSHRRTVLDEALSVIAKLLDQNLFGKFTHSEEIKSQFHVKMRERYSEFLRRRAMRRCDHSTGCVGEVIVYYLDLRESSMSSDAGAITQMHRVYTNRFVPYSIRSTAAPIHNTRHVCSS